MADGGKVTVAGGGPVGGLMAIFLARRGYDVTVYERRPDMRTQPVPAGRSINLALANRGIDALQRVGLMEAVTPHLIPMRGRMIHALDGATELQPYGNKPEEVIYSVSRGELNKIILDGAAAAGVGIHFDCSCTGVDLAKRTARLGDSPKGISCDVLIGADGAGSVVREAIVQATGGAVTEGILDHGYKELTIPAACGGGFAMAENALHIWPRGGFMLIALPNTDGSFTATLFLPNEGEESFSSLRGTVDVERFFARYFPDTAPLIPDLTEAFFRNPTGMLGTIRCFPWRYGGGAVVLGDAAHAIVPFHGQGMNAGFEDCVALDACIARAGGDWTAAFAAFERDRKPNADAIADMALENYVEMRDTVRDPKFLLKKTLAWKLEERFPDRFIPRYSMVMFHRLPYADAYRRGKIQAEILDELTRTATSLADVNFGRAETMIAERL